MPGGDGRKGTRGVWRGATGGTGLAAGCWRRQAGGDARLFVFADNWGVPCSGFWCAAVIWRPRWAQRVALGTMASGTALARAPLLSAPPVAMPSLPFHPGASPPRPITRVLPPGHDPLGSLPLVPLVNTTTPLPFSGGMPPRVATGETTLSAAHASRVPLGQVPVPRAAPNTLAALGAGASLPSVAIASRARPPTLLFPASGSSSPTPGMPSFSQLPPCTTAYSR